MTTTRRRPLAAAALAALALLAPAAVADAARARPRPAAGRGAAVSFRLTAVGSGTFDAKTGAGDTRSGTAHEERVRFRWETSLPRITFRDGVLVGAAIGHTDLTASASYRHESSTPFGTSWERCEGSRADDWGLPDLDTDPLVLPPLSRDAAPEGEESILFRPFERLLVVTECVDSEDNRHSGEVVVNDSSGQPLNIRSEDFDSLFTLPADALDKGKIIQLTQSEDSRRTDACEERTSATSCAFSWRQEITLRAVRRRSARR